MKNNEKIPGETREALKALHRNRTISNPTDGNRTKLTVALCLVLLACLFSSFVYLEILDFSAISAGARIPFMPERSLLIIAICSLLIFLLVDGSPETLALGLFLGFEAISHSAGALVPGNALATALQHILMQMSDILKLYYAAQLARILPKHLGPWLRWGAVLAAPLLLLALTSNGVGSLALVFIQNMREFVVGVAASWICFRVAIAISGDQVPWRVLALSIAGFAFLAKPMGISFDLVSPDKSLLGFKTIALIHLSLSHFGFLLASLFNISTIENRIRALSKAKAKESLEKMREEQRVHEAIAKTTQMLAHDVRKPFSLLKAYTDSLLAAASPGEAAQVLSRMIPDVQKNLNTVDQMISNVMDIGRDLTVQAAPHSVYRVINQSIEQVFRVSSNKNIQFNYHFRHHGKILGDEQQLCRVFSNILENAEQAINGRSEKITISTFSDAGSGKSRIGIEIHNSGSSIPKDDLKNIFDAFFTKGKRGGTGLGLAIVKKIVRTHGGEVSVQSSANHGTTFRFLIPAVSDSTPDQFRLPRNSSEVKLEMALSSVDESLPLGGDGATVPNHAVNILIIDDEVPYAESAKTLLRPYLASSCAILEATNTTKAKEILEAKMIDIVICDYDLGPNDCNGLEFLGVVAQISPASLRVLHTNHLLDAVKLQKQHGQVDLHIKKPISREDLNMIFNSHSRNTRRGRKETIAIIEDDYIFAEHLERQLIGYQVAVFSTPEEFFSHQGGPPHNVANYSAIITDMFFTGTSATGYDIATSIKGKFDVPIFLYSNHQPEPASMRIFDAHIPKASHEALAILGPFTRKVGPVS